MPRSSTNKILPGRTVVVQHGREALSGVVVAASDHPVYGPCVDVEVAGRVRRFVAARVSPTEERKGRQPGKERGPVLDREKSCAGSHARQAAQRGGAL
ncbi:MAG: hypothetical protein DYG93_08475 [Leptolyngbya sp. PLA2]|nr:hypothetical protein [Leptolyngbya sp.]MCE7971679.1 hypothetical protein [Leptolyngbya sp. PL-A2]MCQ3940003.1 hypothetical protein [cyanobacterium CYA1]MDL1903254.1 hypothetical protein [Synechococcales cyanobacterium CNB]